MKQLRYYSPIAFAFVAIVSVVMSAGLTAAASGETSAVDSDALQAALKAIPAPPEYQLPRVDTPDMIVVAADEERRKELSMKGYWCVSEISRAIWSAQDGYTIYVTAGEYRENIVLYGFNDVQLIGEEGALVVADNDEDAFLIQECEDIRIHNVDAVHEVGESPCLHNCFVVWDSSDVLIEYCDISGCGYIGVEVLGNGVPENIRVENCAIHDCEVAYYDVNGGTLRPINNVIWACTEKEW